jgi:hypothetical protein
VTNERRVLKTSVRMEHRYCIRLPGGRGTENARLAVNVKSRFSTDKDQEMLLYLDDRMEPWGRIPHWERGEIRAGKIVNFSRQIHNESLKKFTFKSVDGRYEDQREVFIENEDCEKVLQWFCSAWGEADTTGKVQVVVETVGAGVTDDIGYRLTAVPTPSNVSNERLYYVKASSIIRVAIRNLSTDTMSFTPVYRPSGLEPDTDPTVSLSAGAEARLCRIHVDCNFDWSLENPQGAIMPKLTFEIQA